VAAAQTVTAAEAAAASFELCIIDGRCPRFEARDIRRRDAALRRSRHPIAVNEGKSTCGASHFLLSKASGTSFSSNAGDCWPAPPPTTACPPARAWRHRWGPAAAARASWVTPLLRQPSNSLGASSSLSTGGPLDGCPPGAPVPLFHPPPPRPDRRPHLHHVPEP